MSTDPLPPGTVTVIPPAKKERKPGSGRPLGAQDKVTRTVKQMMLDALDRAGKMYGGPDGDGTDYLAMLAITEPKVFGALIGKLMPMQLGVDVNATGVARIETVILNAPAKPAAPADTEKVVPIRREA